ncbi:DUF4307 domain-containing protein [Amnibacterium flavum]|uniref:DUF4307 domain-containing protein n=1 Tax=Amnibacterium flavum TaxID=2173173 RepID=A0A2V1HML5_9MICO|nr:DUF4307 domain-containing protein [Amnibacterium flavum]PVZ93715.1 DUF4307 domain-containing protein [Amnibacterium flavum]
MSGTTVRHPGAPSDLDARYGRTRRSRLRNRTIAWIAAVAVAVVFAAWVVWAGLDGTGPSLEVRDTGYYTGQDTATARFELTVDPGTPVRCAVQALNAEYEIIGWKVVDIPPSDERTRAFAETVRTTMQPDTGLIYRCWLP